MAKVVYDFYMTQAARALEIACDSRKRKSYRLNRLNDTAIFLQCSFSPVYVVLILIFRITCNNMKFLREKWAIFESS